MIKAENRKKRVNYLFSKKLKFVTNLERKKLTQQKFTRAKVIIKVNKSHT